MSDGQQKPLGPRLDHELPRAITEWGWRFHHVGIPTSTPRPGETHLEAFGMHVSGFPESPYGVEWMRFDADSPISELIRSVPHLAFVVDDLEVALEGKTILTPPNSPSEGLRVAMIVHDGAPIELMEFADARRFHNGAGPVAGQPTGARAQNRDHG